MTYFIYFASTTTTCDFIFFSYILKVPFEQDDDPDSGIVYVWIGSKSDQDEARLIQEIAEEMFNSPWVTLQVLSEGKLAAYNKRTC